MVDVADMIEGDYTIYCEIDFITIYCKKTKKYYSINRSNGEVKLIQIEPSSYQNKTEAYGIYGIIELEGSSYLAVITKGTFLDYFFQNPIIRIDALDYIPLCRRQMNDKMYKSNIEYLKMIESVLNMKCLYFSQFYNLTCRIQILFKLMGNNSEYDISKISDNRFFFNKKLIIPFEKSNFKDLINPVICGSISVRTMFISSKQSFQYLLISRKDVRRLGRRFLSRGIDLEGNVANFTETEQILIHHDESNTKFASYIILRGSVPVIFSQAPTLKYTPSISIKERRENQTPANIHLDELDRFYGKITIINLLNKKGSEERLGNAYEDVVSSKTNKPKFIWFDFHKECGTSKWNNLSLLLNLIKEDIDTFDFFMANIEMPGSKMNLGIFKQNDLIKTMCIQSGAFRVNCLDSLDRTNVVQSEIARTILFKKLFKINIIPKINVVAFEPFPHTSEEAFRTVWSDNGNNLSRIYSGTGAMKSDFTLTGKRTTYGIARDGILSVQRYFINNFTDGYYQDTLNLASGNINHKNYNIVHHKIFKRIQIIFIFVLAILFFLIRKITEYEGFIPKILNTSWLIQFILILLPSLYFFTKFFGKSLSDKATI